MDAPEICPHCGADVPPKARACPECGSDEQTGWSERAKLERLGVPSEDFDYEEFAREEFGEPQPPKLQPRGISPFWWFVAIVLLALIIRWFIPS